jgi:hypothetical protein
LLERSRAKDVVDLARLQGGDGRSTDHATVSDETGPLDPEAAAQPLHDRQQGRHVGGVAGPQEGGDRPVPLIQHDALQNGQITLKDVRLPEANRLQTGNSFRDTARVLRMTRYMVGWASVCRWARSRQH